MKIIVCVNNQGVIGKDMDLIYSFKEDITRFKTLTSSGDDPCIVMGRLTYDSIGKPLPGRTNIVISRQLDLEIPGCKVMTIDEFIFEYEHHPNMWIIGGAQMYDELTPYITDAFVTYVSDSREFDDTYIRINDFMKVIREKLIPIETSVYHEALDRVSGQKMQICYLDYLEFIA